ncbi:MAG TPA: hypothetical protein VFR37_01840, partial [Longimicrobium sp.]|nr:hypothetical protein [Longimicrobium sp.]
DPQDEDGAWYREFTYMATAGERLRVSVGSEHMDTRVLIGTGFDERFDAVAEDDNGGRGGNAELTWTFPYAGEYTLRVTTAIPGEAGPFILRVKSIH